VVVLPAVDVAQVEIVDDDVAVRVRVQVGDERQALATAGEPLVPAVGSFLAEPLLPVVGVPADDVDDARDRRLLGQRLVPDGVDRVGRLVCEMSHPLQRDSVVAGMWVHVDGPVAVEREHEHQSRPSRGVAGAC
jgi:hypothetical protein